MSSEKTNGDEEAASPPDAEGQLERQIAEALGDMSLEDLLDAEDAASGATGPDGKASGTVVDIDTESVFVELDAKTQGILPIGQFAETPLPKVGQKIEFLITGHDRRDDLLMLALPGAAVEADWDSLAVGQIVEGRVTGHNKGGLELQVNGIRAFMPISQIETFRVEDLSPYVEQKFTCQVTEVDRAEKNLIVSRRAVLEAEAERRRAELLASLAEGKQVTGVVRSIMPYGAFVDIGGADGLLHISDMTHSRIDDPRAVVAEGQQLDLKVLKIEEETGRISLGLKQLMPDPWERVAEKWHADQLATGRVTRLMDFGAFVQLDPGVEGLIPMGELSHSRVQRASDVLSEGQSVQVRIMLIDLERRRISLSLKRAGDDPWTGASARWPAGATVEGVVTRLADFGAFVELTPGVEGLVHISELSAGTVRAVGDVVRQNQTVRAIVLSVDEDARRISLSISKAAGPEASAEAPPTAPRPRRKRPLKGGLD